MTTKGYLREIKRLEVIIEERKQQQTEIRERLTSIMSPRLDDSRVQETKGKDKKTTLLTKLEHLDNKISISIEEYYETKDKIISEIQSLTNPVYISILYKRYVEHKNFEKIAVELNYEYQTILNMHGAALKDFERKYKKVYKDVV